MAVSLSVEREGDRVFVAVRTADGKSATIRTTKRGGAALCAVLGQACGRRPAREYAMRIDGDLTTDEQPPRTREKAPKP